MHQAGRATQIEPSLFGPVPQTKGAQNQDPFFSLCCLCSHLQKGDPAPATTESGVKAVNRGFSSSLGSHSKMPGCFLKKKVKSSSCGISLVLRGTEQPLRGGKISAEGPENANKCPLATSHS